MTVVWDKRCFIGTLDEHSKTNISGVDVLPINMFFIRGTSDVILPGGVKNVTTIIIVMWKVKCVKYVLEMSGPKAKQRVCQT